MSGALSEFLQASSGATSFLGRPPSLPFVRAAVLFASVVALPPARPMVAAIHRREPRNPSSSAGK